MPIHDQGYRRYAGRRQPAGRRWWIIARAGLIGLIRRRSFLGLLVAAWLPFLVRVVQIYVSSNFQQASFLALKTETFREFLEQQGPFVFFVTIYAGAGLIANDRRVNALQIYLSKPLTRLEYVVGKLAVLAAFLLLVTWAPAMMLLIVQALFAGSTTFVRNNLFLVPAVTLLSLVQVILAASTMVALSSLSRSSRFVAIMYTGVMLFTSGVSSAVRAMTGRTTLAWISPGQMLEQIGDAIFRLRPRYDVPIGIALLVVCLLIIASAVILERRVRGVEVVT